MERIYDILQRITSLWKELELTKLDSSEYVALLNQIRVLSEEYEALIDAPKSQQTTKGGPATLLTVRSKSVADPRGVKNNCRLNEHILLRKSYLSRIVQVLVNAVTGEVGSSTKMSGKPTQPGPILGVLRILGIAYR
jgi:hypothetical protein